MALKDFGKKGALSPAAFSEAPKTLFGPRGMPVEYSEEVQRVLDLPRRPPIDLDSLEAQVIVARETAKYARDRAGLGKCKCRELDPSSPCITTLLPVQAVTLREIGLAQGLWGSIVTGGGKSILDILAILALEDCEMGLLLVPANLMRQIFRQWEILSNHFRVPKMIAHTKDGDLVGESPTGERAVLHVMSHNGISSKKQSDFIEKIRPQVIIIDEVDAFSDLTSARTIRLVRFMTENIERTRFCCWTGSAADRRIEEFAHLIGFALKDKSPLPIPTHIVTDWGRCLNAVDNPCPAGALAAFIGPEDEADSETEQVRNAFARRLEETLGVIMTESADVRISGGDSLVQVEVAEREAPAIPEIVQKALDMVRGGERPDTLMGNEHNETFDDPKEKVRCAREVSCGMFYRFVFPRREPREVIDRWFEVRAQYNSEVRSQIMRGERFLDSPGLCEDAAKRYHGDLPPDPRRPVWASRHWPEWRLVKDTVEPQSAACRLSDFVVRDAIEWAQTHRGIIWYSNADLAKWISELSGLPVYGGGPDAEERIERLMRSGRRETVVCSMNSHGRGRDGLQKLFDEQLILNVPSSSRRNQQVYARLHRNGQTSEVVRSWYYGHTPELASAHESALRRSDFVETLLRQRQKLKMGLRA